MGTHFLGTDGGPGPLGPTGVGGHGGFGGGGGAAYVVAGLGGFGAGNAHAGYTNGIPFTPGGIPQTSGGATTAGAAGGGGLGAGGDIFVQGGASLVIAGSATLANGSVSGGAGNQPGQAFGSGIYLQGNNTLTFTPAGTQTVAGVIGDDTGSAAAAGYGGAAGYTEGTIGLLVNGTGTLKLSAANTFSGGTTLHSGALELAAHGAAGSGAISFTGASTLILDTPALDGGVPQRSFATQIEGFAAGNTIDLPGQTYASGWTAALDGSVPTQLDIVVNTVTIELPLDAGVAGHTFYLAPDSGGGTEVFMCFCTGTRIATPQGGVAVETLQPGDLVSLADGRALPVRWLGVQTVSRRFADPARVVPVRIRAGALGENLPARDLLLSPAHAVLIDGLLVQAAALVNGHSIVRDNTVPDVFQYWHIELEEHAILLAEGVPAESLLDQVDPVAFDNAAGRPFAEPLLELPYPRVKSARQMPAWLRQRLQGALAA